ncbi:MAG: M1 family aminopeptidase [Abditibacteriaceae bacterium]
MANAQDSRPQYNLHLKLDYAQMSYDGSLKITVPVKSGDQFNEVDFHLYANSPGVTRANEKSPNLVVEKVLSGNDEKLTFSQQGTLLKVLLPTPKSTFAKLQISWRGKVPTLSTPASALADLMPMDLGDVTEEKSEKSTYRDYGLYSFRNGILSLGTYWFPMLALRFDGKWQDEILPGPGDLSVAAASDYKASIEVTNAPTGISIITTQASAKANSLDSQIDAARDFPIVIGENFEAQTQDIKLGARTVHVSSWARTTDAAKSKEVLDVAAHALQIYSKRFGDYPYDHFTIVQGPLSGGAGGAEFSGLAIIAQALYGDIDREMASAFGPLGISSSAPIGLVMKQQLDSVKSLLETSVAHETGHQWWSIGVGSDARLDPWLDESLTNYCAMLYYKDRYGAKKYAQMINTTLSKSYQMARLLGFQDAKVGGATDQFTGDLQYGAIVYGKGALFYQALDQLIGDKKFDAALQKYFSQYYGKMATDSHLIQTFKNIDPAQSDKIELLYQHWIWQLDGDDDIGVLSF